MNTSTNYGLKKPEGTDVINISDFNENADIIDGKLKELETNEIYYSVATGTANNYAITVSAIKSLYDGLAICPKINIASTGASVINVNGYGEKAIIDSLGNPITSGGLKANTPYTLRYNGSVFILQGKGGGGNVTADKLLTGTTATGDSGAIVGTMPNNGAVTITPGATTKTIPSGYHNGAGTVATDVNLVTGNIIAGKSIFGVAGKASVVDTSSANATASQILNGYTGYVNGTKLTGIMVNHTGVDSDVNSIAGTTQGTLYARPQAGYYSGSEATVIHDGNFVTSSIISGRSIFGVAGSATIESLGGRKYQTVTYSHTYNTSGLWEFVYFNFAPTTAKIRTANNTMYTWSNATGTARDGSGVTTTSFSMSSTGELLVRILDKAPTGTYTFEIWS